MILSVNWTKSGWHGWVYGWKPHLVATVAKVWIPLAAELTPANPADSEVAHALPHSPPVSRSGTRGHAAPWRRLDAGCAGGTPRHHVGCPHALLPPSPPA